MDALVDNAADEGQIKEAEIKLANREQLERSDLLWVLDDIRGRRFLWRVLSHCRAFESIMHLQSEIAYYNSGQQDLGHLFLGWIQDTSQESLFQMMRENRKVKKNERRNSSGSGTGIIRSGGSGNNGSDDKAN